MAVLQHYYTSSPRNIDGTSGWGVKAESPGIAPDDSEKLSKLTWYEIPINQGSSPIETHPISLRYLPWDAIRCSLACCQSSEDSYNRPIYFGHSLLLSQDDFQYFPPIQFWRHSFWKTVDPSSAVEIPPLPYFDLQPSFELELLWPFLEADGDRRRHMILGLLDCFLQEKGRRILILDDIDNVALWIMALSFSLPAEFRKSLSFATYHPDPRQTPFRVTGVSQYSKITFQSEDYQTFYIVNEVDHQISKSATSHSKYASFLVNHLERRAFEHFLPDFLITIDNRLKTCSKANTEEELVNHAAFYQAIREKTLPIDDIRAQKGINNFLEYIRQAKNITQDDVIDLSELMSQLQLKVQQTKDKTTFEQLGETKKLYKQHVGSLENLIAKEIDFYLQLIKMGDEELVSVQLKSLLDVYSEQSLSEYLLSQSENLRIHINDLSMVHPRFLRLLWKYLVPYLHVNDSRAMMIDSLVRNSMGYIARQMPDTHNKDIPPASAKEMLLLMDSAMSEAPGTLLSLAIRHSGANDPYPLMWLYYQLFGGLEDKEREPYRKQLSVAAPDILFFEIRREILSQSKDTLPDFMLDYINCPWPRNSDHIKAIHSTLEAGWPRLDNDQKRLLAVKILQSPNLAMYLDSNVEEKLTSAYFFDMPINKIPPGQMNLYIKYQNYAALDVETRGIIGVRLAMTNGTITLDNLNNAPLMLRSVNANKYAMIVTRVMDEFFTRQPFDPGLHLNMIKFLYIIRHEKEFWEIYWHHLTNLIIHRENAEMMVELLSFWFDQAVKELKDYPYLVPTFFMEFPKYLELASEDRGYEKASERILQIAQSKNKPWLEMASIYITCRKRKSFLSFLNP